MKQTMNSLFFSYIVKHYQRYVYIEIILFSAPGTAMSANLTKYKEAPTKENIFSDRDSKYFRSFLEAVNTALPTAVLFLPG